MVALSYSLILAGIQLIKILMWVSRKGYEKCYKETQNKSDDDNNNLSALLINDNLCDEMIQMPRQISSENSHDLDDSVNTSTGSHSSLAQASNDSVNNCQVDLNAWWLSNFPDANATLALSQPSSDNVRDRSLSSSRDTLFSNHNPIEWNLPSIHPRSL